MDPLTRVPTLEGYHPLPAVRGDLLERVGRREEAAEAFERAASLTRNGAERELLRGRAERARADGEG